MATKFQLKGSLSTLFDAPKNKDGETTGPADNENSEDVKYVSVWETLPKEVWTKKNVHVPKHHDAVRVGFCTKFGLMQRKELKLMCRKKWIFLAQLVLPILIVFCFNLRALLLRMEIEDTDFTPFVLSPVDMKQCDGTILLAPPFNESTIIKRLAEFLNNETTTSNLKFDEHPDMNRVNQSIGSACGTIHFTSQEMLDTNSMTSVSSGIKFVFPNTINYQLRLRAVQWSLSGSAAAKNVTVHAEPSKWATDRIYPKHLVVGPRNKQDNEGGTPGYASEGFLYLQQRIDLALISLIHMQETGKPFKNEYFLQLERFPFPAFESSNMIYLIQFELPFILLFAFLIQLIIATYLAVQEKETGAKAFLKSFGVSNFLQMLPFILKGMIQYTLVNLIITFLLCAKWYEDGLSHVALIDETSFSLIFVLLELVTFNTCTLSYFISVFFINAKYAAWTAAFYWIFFNLPFLYFSLRNFIQNPLAVQYLSSLFAQTGLRTALQYISLSETNVGGTHWEDLLETRFDVGHVFIMLVVGGIVTIVLAIYIENVFPTSVRRRHLVPLPKLYFLRCWWWKGQLPPDKGDAPEDNDVTPLPEFFEPEPKYMKLEFQIKSLSKCYVGNVGVFNITMNFYEGEISVILGALGSGKSTLFGLLAGIISPTRGAILLNNVNVRTEAGYMKYNLGICPQGNFLYDYLTVEEHITLFALLKGFRSMGDASSECDVLTKGLKLKSIRNHRASKLNYSQKRLVHIAIAFCAGSKVVILDEPTADIDASSKRIVWGFLQKEKKRRTIIVLTSDTEEANFVTDRIAILVNGEIQCRGSLSFIKSKFGGGYTLQILKGSNFKKVDVTQFVQTTIPNSSVATQTEEYISYYLPGEYAFKFADLLDHLESRTTTYDIEDITISYVTMDEVFKKVRTIDEPEGTATKMESKRRHTRDFAAHEVSRAAVSLPKEGTVCNCFHQFVYLLLKNMRVTYRRKWYLLLPYLISISIMAAVCAVIYASPFERNLPSMPINLDKLKEILLDPGFLLQCEEQYTGNKFCDVLSTVAHRYAHIHMVDMAEIGSKLEDLILRTYNKKRSLAASELAMAVNTARGTASGLTTRITMFFDNQALHIAPVAVNFASNLILTHVLYSAGNVGHDYAITTENFPLEYQTIQTLGLAEVYSSNGFYLGLALTWAMTFFMPVLIVLPIREKYFKHIQFICGANSFLFWFTKVLRDFLLYDILVACICIILHFTNVFRYKPKENSHSSSDFARSIQLLHAYGFASIGLINCMVPLFRRSGVVGYFCMWLVFFATGPLILSTLLITDEDKDSLLSSFMKENLEGFIIFPGCALGLGMFNVYTRYRFDSECTDEDRVLICPTIPNHGCCIEDPFFHNETGYGIGEYLVALLVVGFVTHMITLFLETNSCRVFWLWLRNSRIWRCCCCCSERKRKVVVIDEDPLPELDFRADRSEDGSRSSLSAPGPGDQLDDENYEIIMSNIFHQTKGGRVLLDIPKLRLRKHECNGCLGLDGSGKSFLLQVVAGFVTPDMGDVRINKKSLLRNYRKYLKLISYAPDHQTLLPELTGSETLALCGMLRRTPASKMRTRITAVCIKLNLFKDLEHRVGEYSPGTLKKLVLAIALINNPGILICEEPTRDVDPESRLQIIRTLADLKKTSSILLSTSDMELCEQLCDRVVVFGRTGGRIRCYGSPNYLRATYCDNNMITATLIPDAPYTYYPGNVVELGWDYEKDPLDSNSIHSGPSILSIHPANKIPKSSVQSVKVNLKPGTNVVSKDKVRYHPRRTGSQTQPNPHPSMADIRNIAGKPQPHMSMADIRNFTGKPMAHASLADIRNFAGKPMPHASMADIRNIAGKQAPPSGSAPNIKDYIKSKGVKPPGSMMAIHGGKEQRSFSLFPSNKVFPEEASKNAPKLSDPRQSISSHRGSIFNTGSKMSIFGSFFSKDLPKYEYQSESSDTFTSSTVMEHWQVELIPLINFIESQFPDAELINIHQCFVQFLLKSEVRLSDVYKKMAIAKEYLDVEHFSVGKMSLEQFFLHYIKGQASDDRQ